MTAGSVCSRSALVVAGAFAGSALACAALLGSEIPVPTMLYVGCAHASALVICLLCLSSMDRNLRRTINELTDQVKAVGQGHMEERVQSGPSDCFPLSQALNVAVGNLSMLLARRDRELGDLETAAAVDALTGLAARQTFMDHLSGLLSAPSQGTTGGLLIVRIDDVAGLNHRIGRERTDELMRSMAVLLQTQALFLNCKSALVARLNGSEFAVLIPFVESSALNEWTQSVSHALHRLKQRSLTDRARVGWVASSVFHGGEGAGELLSRIDHALHRSEAENTAWLLVPRGTALSIPTTRWRAIIDSALDTGRADLGFSDAHDAKGSVNHWVAYLRLLKSDGNSYPEDEVLAAALRTAREADIDLRIVELALAAAATAKADILVRMSARSAERPSFLHRLNTALSANPGHAARLMIAIDLHAELDLIGALGPLSAMLAKHQVRLGVDQVHSPSQDVDRLRQLGVSFLRLSSSVSNGLGEQGSAGKRNLIQLIAQVASAEQLQVLGGVATSVADAQALRELGMPCAGPKDSNKPAAATQRPKTSAQEDGKSGSREPADTAH
jgi:diguanylate cyclase (GGDEF)-like protein